jgi:hypothetical protein
MALLDNVEFIIKQMIRCNIILNAYHGLASSLMTKCILFHVLIGTNISKVLAYNIGNDFMFDWM